jgi:hypothetical protein
MNNLALVLQAQGNLEEARLLHVEALEGRRRVLGSDHPSTLTSMLNLGTLMSKLNDGEAAAALLRECFDGMQRGLGQNHPHTIACKEWMEHLSIAQ